MQYHQLPEYNEEAIQQAFDALDWTGYPEDFPRRVVTHQAWSVRRPVMGVGICDSPYVMHPQRIVCPVYCAWHGMLARCYSHKQATRSPAYKGVSVCDEWLVFSNFRRWMLAQPNWYRRAVDSDLLTPENKHYSPATSLMVPQAVNNLFRCGKSRKVGQPGTPAGVFRKAEGRYRAHVNTARGKLQLGTFDTIEEASAAYRSAKLHHCLTVAHQYLDEPLLFAAIIDNTARVFAPEHYH